MAGLGLIYSSLNGCNIAAKGRKGRMGGAAVVCDWRRPMMQFQGSDEIPDKMQARV